MATAYWVSRAVYVVAATRDRGRAEGWGAGLPRRLAAATGTHAPALRRVLRSLASVGLFSTDSQGRFSLTPLGAVAPVRCARRCPLDGDRAVGRVVVGGVG